MYRHVCIHTRSSTVLVHRHQRHTRQHALQHALQRTLQRTLHNTLQRIRQYSSTVVHVAVCRSACCRVRCWWRCTSTVELDVYIHTQNRQYSSTEINTIEGVYPDWNPCELQRDLRHCFLLCVYIYICMKKCIYMHIYTHTCIYIYTRFECLIE